MFGPDLLKRRLDSSYPCHKSTKAQVYRCSIAGLHASFTACRPSSERLRSKLHFWPFDGWEVPARTPVIAEVYPALWNKTFSTESRTRDQQDAFAIAEWMRRTDNDGSLARFFQPKLDAYDRAMADVEGWILGVEA